MKLNWSKIIFNTVVILTLLSVATTGYRYLVLRDYETYDDTEEEYDEDFEELEE